MKKEWVSIETNPPDKEVQVMDENGNIANAIPCYRPFKVVPSKTKKGKWTSEIEPCNQFLTDL